jgi:NAD(P)-dependent dehydrogenase (short-subunit alcohol dehydrogenase family)
VGRFDGKVAIVIGGGLRPVGEGEMPEPGVGAATCMIMAREGARVLVVDIDPDRAQRTCALAQDLGADRAALLALGLDAATAEGAASTVNLATERFGRLDAVVHNVASTGNSELLETSEDDWDRQIRLNATSLYLLCKAAIPAMIEGGGGSIVTISSIAAVRGYGTGAYAAAKGANVSLMVDVAASYGRYGIRANAVMPGHIRGPFVAEADWPGHEHMLDPELRRSAAPLGTYGRGQDVAYAAAFLSSDEARWITGVVVPVDAGTLTVTPTMMFSAMSAARP